MVGFNQNLYRGVSNNLPIGSPVEIFNSDESVYHWIELTNFETSGGFVDFTFKNNSTGQVIKQSQRIEAGSWAWYRVWAVINPNGGDWTSHVSNEVDNIRNASTVPLMFQVSGVAIPPPLPPLPPDVGPELYEFTLSTHVGIAVPELSGWIVEKMRNVLAKAGWGLSNIRTSGNAYIIQMEKLGSVTVIILIGLIVAILSLVGIKLITGSMERLKTKEVQSLNSSNIENNISEALDYCTTAGLDPVECQDLIKGIRDTYEIGLTLPLLPPADNGDGKGFLDGIFGDGKLLAGAGGTIVILGGLYLLTRNK